MSSISSSRHNTLNTKQLAILDLLFRFRFGTTELFTIALGTKYKTKMNERLRILLDQEYIGRHYEPTYRLQNKHASYHLLPKAMKVLRKLDDKYNETTLRNIYKDKSASEQFITHNLTIFKIYCDLKTKHGDKLKFFTKSQLKAYEYFPDPLPDAYFRIATDNDTGSDNEPEQYFLEVLESTRPFFVSVRKARRYIEYDESGVWEDTGTSLPTVVLVCDSETLRRRMERRVGWIEAGLEDDKFIITTGIAEVLTSASI